MAIEKISVLVYKMIGPKPDTGNDTLLGAVDVYPDTDPTWVISQVNLPAGNHTLYTAALDRMGNGPTLSKTVTIKTQVV